MAYEDLCQPLVKILRHEQDRYERDKDPVDEDWNQILTWPMPSLTNWVARRLCFVHYFKTQRLRRAFDECRIGEFPTNVNRSDCFDVDLDVEVVF